MEEPTRDQRILQIAGATKTFHLHLALGRGYLRTSQAVLEKQDASSSVAYEEELDIPNLPQVLATSLYESSVLQATKLTEAEKNSAGVEYLLKQIKSFAERHLTGDDQAEVLSGEEKLRAELVEVRERLKPITRHRNKLIAHLDKDLLPEELATDLTVTRKTLLRTFGYLKRARDFSISLLKNVAPDKARDSLRFGMAQVEDLAIGFMTESKGLGLHFRAEGVGPYRNEVDPGF